MDGYIEEAPCFYFSCRDDGTLVEVNKTLCDRLGYVKEELEGKKADVIFTLATRIFQQTHFFPLLKMQGHAEEIFVTLQTKNKEHVAVLINATRKETKGEIDIIHVGIEVQNRKQFEDELIAARKAAEKALTDNTTLTQAKLDLQEHMEALDFQMNLVRKQNKELLQFNKVITHDLQEPLRKLSVFARMILNKEGQQAQQTIVERLLAVSVQMRTIVSGLQQYIWLTETTIKLSQVSVDKVVAHASERLRNEFPEVDLIIETKDLPDVFADEEQMQILIYQLLSNAMRFRKPGKASHVRLSAHELMLNRFRNLEGKYKYTRFLKLDLADQGVGFNAEYKEQTFELFKRLHTESGSGVGLALCRKIVENHSGQISIDSSEGAGATVTILLPTDNATSIDIQ